MSGLRVSVQAAPAFGPRQRRAPRARATLGACALLGLLLLAALSGAHAATRQEPIDLGPEVSVIRGEIPYRAGDGRDRASAGYHDAGWATRAVPGLHGDAGGGPDPIGWYRVHLRAAEWPSEQLAVQLPPIYGAWELWFNGRLIAGSGDLDAAEVDPGQEAERVVPLDSALVRTGENLLALRVGTYEGLNGITGPLRVGARDSLVRVVERRGVLSLAVGLTFLILGLFALALFVADPRDRLAVLFAATLLGLAAYAATNNSWWYYFLDDTETKIRLRYAVFYLLHLLVLSLVEHLFSPGSRATARLLGGAALLLSLGAAVLPLGVVLWVFDASWLLTAGAVLFALHLGRDLSARSAAVRGGVRAAFVGLLLTVLFEVAAGTWRFGGTGPFEVVFLVLLGTVAAVFAVTQARAQRRAVSVLRSSRDGVAVLDLEGAVQLVNPALEAMLDTRGETLQSKGLAAFTDAAGQEGLRAMVAALAVRAPGVGGERCELNLKGPGGEVLEVEGIGVRLDDVAVLLTFRDLTARNRLEEEVARAQRLDSLGMLAGGIAHDFNNLLAGVLVNATELEQNRLEPAERGQRLRSIAEAARRGGALTQRLLQFARGRVSPPVGVDLETQLPDMLDMLARTLGRHIEWSIEIESDLPSVRLDEAELEQILVNLCVNARDAMAPGGGTITVVAATDQRSELVKLSVSDDGPGMTPELVARAVEPFVTTKGSGAGTGLGLAVVHGLVVGRGGQMALRSAPGAGTTVTLLLPLMGETVSASLPAEGMARPTEGCRVLLVEDEQALRTFLCRALERRSVHVLALSDGEAVMRWIAEQDPHRAPPVDAVIMDMMMPVVDGMEATRALRAVWPGLPVVISSGYTGRESIEPLMTTGPTLLLEKPYQVEDLIGALGRVMAPGHAEAGRDD